MGFTPARSGTSRVKAPPLTAVVVAAAPVASLRATTVARVWVLPVIVTVGPLMIAPSSGAVTVIFGFEVSSTKVIAGELALSPPGPTSVADTSLRPTSRGRSSTTNVGVWPTETSRTATGSWSGRAT